MRQRSFPEDYVLRDGIHVPDGTEEQAFAYNDGDAAEEYLLELISGASDRSVLSQELKRGIRDWPSRYHLAAERANLLRPFAGLLKGRILEVGAGCGAVSRYLGENGGQVVALEVSLRRARIARARTADLPNVSVICDRIDTLAPSKRFSAVVAIGVLEYAAIYGSKTEQPHIAFLECLKGHLADNGVLILAIENKLGLKYFAGAREDHTGRPFFGINGSYDSGSVATFGRQELVALLGAAGLRETAFFYPCPDYKLPVTVLSDPLLDRFPDLASSLYAQAAVFDPQRPQDPTFSLERGWSSVGQNRLLGQLANSFLVVAGRTAKAIAPYASLKSGAWHYSVNRHPAFARETRFEATRSAMRVKRIALVNVAPPEVPLHCTAMHEPLRTGSNWWDALVAVLNKPDWTISQLAQWARPWLDALARECGLGDFRPDIIGQKVEGRHFDATPFNMVRDQQGRAQFFDQEWTLTADVEFGFLVYRGLRDSLGRVTSGASPAAGTPVQINKLVVEILAECGAQLSPADIDRYAMIEAKVQAWVQGQDNTAPADWAASLWKSQLPERLPAQREELIRTTNILRTELRQVHSDMSVLTQDRETLARELAQSRMFADRQTAALEQQSALTARYEDDLAKLRKETASRITELEHELGSARADLDQSHQRVQQLSGELDEALARIRDLERHLDSTRSILRESQAQTQHLTGELDEASSRIAELETNLGNTRSLLLDSQAYSQRLREELSITQDALARAKADVQALTAERDALSAEKQTLTRERDEYARIKSDLEIRLHSEREQHQKRIQDLASEIARLRDQHQRDVEELRRHANAERESHKQELHAARRYTDELGATLATQAREIEKLARKRARNPFTAIARRIEHAFTTWKCTRFRHRSWEAGVIRASRLFSPVYYLERYPDVDAAGMDPLLHYIQYGANEDRIPHPLFDPGFYLSQVPDANKIAMTPLAHYVTAGVAAGLDPHPLFDTDFYLQQNPDVANAGINPLYHYTDYGWRERRNPHPLFNTGFYLDSNPAVAASGQNPLLHYIAHANGKQQEK